MSRLNQCIRHCDWLFQSTAKPADWRYQSGVCGSWPMVWSCVEVEIPVSLPPRGARPGDLETSLQVETHLMLWFMVCYGMVCCCTSVCYGVLLYITVCYGVLLYIMVCYGMGCCVMVYHGVLRYGVLCYGISWCVTVWCVVLLYITVCWCVAVHHGVLCSGGTEAVGPADRERNISAGWEKDLRGHRTHRTDGKLPTAPPIATPTAP